MPENKAPLNQEQPGANDSLELQHLLLSELIFAPNLISYLSTVHSISAAFQLSFLRAYQDTYVTQLPRQREAGEIDGQQSRVTLSNMPVFNRNHNVFDSASATDSLINYLQQFVRFLTSNSDNEMTKLILSKFQSHLYSNLKGFHFQLSEEQQTEQSIQQLQQMLAYLQQANIHIALVLKEIPTPQYFDQEKTNHLINQLVTFTPPSGFDEKTNQILKGFLDYLEAIQQLLANEENSGQKDKLKRYRSSLINCFSSFVDNALGEEAIHYRESINNFFKAVIKQKVETLKHNISSKKIKVNKQVKLHWAGFSDNFDNINSTQSAFSALGSLNQCIFHASTSVKKNKKGQVFLRKLERMREKVHQWLNSNTDNGLHFIQGDDKNDYQKLAIQQQVELINKLFSNKKSRLEKRLSSFAFKKALWWRSLFGFNADTVSEENFKLLENLLQKNQELNDLLKKSFWEPGDVEKKYIELIGYLGIQLNNAVIDESGKKHNTLLTKRLNIILAQAGISFPSHPTVNKHLNILYRIRQLKLPLLQYAQRRNAKKWLRGGFDFKAFGNSVFDYFKPGGKRKRGNSETHDGNTHRQAAVLKLMRKIDNCNTCEDYVCYVAQALLEISKIKDKDSRLRKILLKQINQVIADQVLPKGTDFQKSTIYQMLYTISKNHAVDFSIAKPLEKAIKKEEGLKKADFDNYYKNSKLVNHKEGFIKAYLNNSSGDALVINEDPIANNPALEKFYKIICSSFSRQLEACRLTKANVFRVKNSKLVHGAASVAEAAKEAVEAFEVPLVSPIASLLINAAVITDRHLRKVRFANIAELLETAQMTDLLSQYAAKNLTRIWEYQIKKLHGADPKNVEIFANCMVERMLDYLEKGCYQGRKEPIELQLLAAVRTQNILHRPFGTPLLTKNSCSYRSASAQDSTVEYLLKRTPIKDADSSQVYMSSMMDTKLGATRDGAAIAEMLNIRKAGSTEFINPTYTAFKYKTAAPHTDSAYADQGAKIVLDTQLQKNISDLEKQIENLSTRIADLEQKLEQQQHETLEYRQQAQQQYDALQQKMHAMQQQMQEAIYQQGRANQQQDCAQQAANKYSPGRGRAFSAAAP